MSLDIHTFTTSTIFFGVSSILIVIAMIYVCFRKTEEEKNKDTKQPAEIQKPKREIPWVSIVYLLIPIYILCRIYQESGGFSEAFLVVIAGTILGFVLSATTNGTKLKNSTYTIPETIVSLSKEDALKEKTYLCITIEMTSLFILWALVLFTYLTIFNIVIIDKHYLLWGFPISIVVPGIVSLLMGDIYIEEYLGKTSLNFFAVINFLSIVGIITSVWFLFETKIPGFWIIFLISSIASLMISNILTNHKIWDYPWEHPFISSKQKVGEDFEKTLDVAEKQIEKKLAELQTKAAKLEEERKNKTVEKIGPEMQEIAELIKLLNLGNRNVTISDSERKEIAKELLISANFTLNYCDKIDSTWFTEGKDYTAIRQLFFGKVCSFYLFKNRVVESNVMGSSYVYTDPMEGKVKRYNKNGELIGYQD